MRSKSHPIEPYSGVKYSYLTEVRVITSSSSSYLRRDGVFTRCATPWLYRIQDFLRLRCLAMALRCPER